MAAIDKMFTRPEPAVGIRAMHIDCKGVPPTPQRLLELLDVAAKLRFNAVCIEWEDMFPWTVDRRFRCETAYMPDDVRAVGAKAAELGLQVIPLVQCLGHMEFALKLDDYAQLRERPENIGCLNPIMDEAREFVQALVEDVLALLPNVTRFHLGGDEAWTFGTNLQTRAFVEENGKGALYLRHLEPILDMLNARGARPMLWHDMMVEWTDEALAEMGKRADLVLWGYNGDPECMGEKVCTAVFQRFAKLGINMWGATAYKGANGCNVDLPVFETRRDNVVNWAATAQKHGLVGIITTAWSRYMHLEVQCEPIDGALDSLAAHGIVLHEGRMPAGGREACVEALAAIGEKERFEKCFAALSALTTYRQEGWAMVQQLREEAVVIERDVRRKATAWMSLANLRKHAAKGQDVALDVHEALAGLVNPLWVQRYLDSRIEPFRTEAGDLKRLLEALSA